MSEEENSKQTLTNCARCGGEHEDIEFKSFENQPNVYREGGGQLKKWAMCPETDEPILGFVVDVENIEDEG